MGAVTFIRGEGGVFLEVEDGTARLLDLGHRSYRFYGLSNVATRMLRTMFDACPDAGTQSDIRRAAQQRIAKTAVVRYALIPP
jgi:hypothetical protein